MSFRSTSGDTFKNVSPEVDRNDNVLVLESSFANRPYPFAVSRLCTLNTAR